MLGRTHILVSSQAKWAYVFENVRIPEDEQTLIVNNKLFESCSISSDDYLELHFSSLGGGRKSGSGIYHLEKSQRPFWHLSENLYNAELISHFKSLYPQLTCSS